MARQRDVFDCLADCTLNVCGDGFVGPAEVATTATRSRRWLCGRLYARERRGRVIFCGNKIYQCGDTLDNDMDGLIDLDDPSASRLRRHREQLRDQLARAEQRLQGRLLLRRQLGWCDDLCEWDLKCDPSTRARRSVASTIQLRDV